MSSEAMALVESLGHLEWVICMYLECFDPTFRLENREESFSKVRSWQVIDAKSVFDHLRSMNPSAGCEDKRTGLDCIVAKECLQRLGCRLRWGPGPVQLADVLTKDTGDAADTWRGHLRRGLFRLAKEDEALAVRAEERLLRKRRGQERQALSEEAAAKKTKYSQSKQEESEE